MAGGCFDEPILGGHHASQDIAAGAGMTLDQAPLGIGQWAGLGHDLRGQVQHAHIVQESRQDWLVQPAFPFVIRAHQPRHHLSHNQTVAGDVAGGIGRVPMQKTQGHAFFRFL